MSTKNQKQKEKQKQKQFFISNKLFETESFKIVGRKHPDLHFGLNLTLFQTNTHRYTYIKKLIQKQAETLKDITQEELNKRKREVIVVVHDAWINQYMDNIYNLTSSVKLLTFFHHTICLVDKTPTNGQLLIDFYGLCWLYWFETGMFGKSEDIDLINTMHHAKNLKECYEKGLQFEKANLDIIVTIESWKYFLCMLIGIEFYHIIRKNEFMYGLYHKQTDPFSIYDIHVFSKDFGLILFPLKDTLLYLQTNSITHFPNWYYINQ
jgi:hypothetical protein